MLLHKKIWAGPICLAIAVGLSGCNNQQAAENKNFQDTTTGNQSAEKNQLVQNLSSKGEAPLTNDLGYKDDRYPTKDINYHGHTSKSLPAKSSYYTSYEGKLVERINRQVNSVHHVKDARSLIIKEDIIVSVLLDDHREAKKVEVEINKKIKPFIKNRTLHITTNENNYHRTVRLDNSVRRGDSTDLLNLDATDFFNNHENQLK